MLARAQLLHVTSLVLESDSRRVLLWNSQNGISELPIVRAGLAEEGILNERLATEWARNILDTYVKEWSLRQVQVWHIGPAVTSPADWEVWQEVWEASGGKLRGHFSPAQASRYFVGGGRAPNGVSCIVHVGRQSSECLISRGEEILQHRILNTGWQQWLDHASQVLSERFSLSFPEGELAKAWQSVLDTPSKRSAEEPIISLEGLSGMQRHQVAFTGAELRPIAEKYALWLARTVESSLSGLTPQVVLEVVQQGVVCVGSGLGSRVTQLLTRKLRCPVVVPAQPERTAIEGVRQWLSGLSL